MKTITIERKITLGFAIAMLILCIFAVFGYLSIRQSIITANDVNRSHQVIETIDDLFSSLIDIDDGCKTYVLSGDKTFSKRFHDAMPVIPPKLEQLRTLMAEHPRQVERLHLLDSLVAQETARVCTIMQLHASGRFTEARDRSAANEGKLLILGIRGIMKEMDGQENKVLLRRISTAQFEVRTATVLLLLGGFFSFFFVGISKFIIDRDMKQQRIVEISLRDSDERFQVAARATHDIIWDWNIRTNDLWLSEPFETLFGPHLVGAPQSIDARWRRLHPDDAIRVISGLQAAIERGETYWCDEYRFCRPDGSYADIYDRGYLLYEGQGHPVRMIGSMMDITERKRAEDEISNSRLQLRALAARIQSVREEEGKRIARRIHDELGQMLTVLKIDIQLLEKKLLPEQQPLIDKAKKMSSAVCEAMLTVQRISTELRPGILEFGLTAAIEWQIRDFQTRTGIQCKFAVFDEGFTLDDDERSTAIFRIFQEILTNIMRHAQATKARICLDKEEGVLILRVTDNGKGISERQINDSHSLGLIGMRERALIVGGTVEVCTADGGGTAVIVRIPVEANQCSQALSA